MDTELTCVETWRRQDGGQGALIRPEWIRGCAQTEHAVELFRRKCNRGLSSDSGTVRYRLGSEGALLRKREIATYLSEPWNQLLNRDACSVQDDRCLA